MKTTLYWIRRDLRLADNLALLEAAKRGAVLPVYVHAPQELAPWQPGGASNWWLHHSLEALSRQLESLGCPLLIRRGPSLNTLLDLAQQTGADRVMFNRLYEPAEAARDRQVTRDLEAIGIAVDDFPGALLAEPESVNTRQGGHFKVFTPYWKALQALGEPQSPLPPPGQLRPPAHRPAGLTVQELALAPDQPWTHRLGKYWQPGESHAIDRLELFCDDPVTEYPEKRDFPAVDGVSRLSPRLHFGELTPAQVWHQLGAAAHYRDSEAGIAAFRRQLAWREFAHHVLWHYPDSPREPMYPQYRAFPWRENYQPLLRAWQTGRTGIPIVDAGMRELWHTGWMHNRVRMICASLLVKNLRVPWWEGAAWFHDTLVDADLANNTLGWQWSAGCGVDAAPYFRIFNPVLQGERFDGAGTYVRRWLPELSGVPDRWLNKPWDWPQKTRLDYPEPVVDLATSRQEALDALAAMREMETG